MSYEKIILVIYCSLISFNFQALASDSSLNLKPEIVSNFPENAKANAEYKYYLQAMDKNNDSLIFVTKELPGWLTLVDSGNGNALLSGTPKYSDVGDNKIMITVTDNKSEEPVVQEFIINVEQVDPPHFTVHPKNLNAIEHEKVTLDVKAEGFDIRYQWQKNNKDIKNGKDSVMIIDYVSMKDNNASFRCIASNQGGSDTSYAGILEVEAASMNSIYVYDITQVLPLNSTSQVLSILPGGTETSVSFLIRPEANWVSASLKIFTVSGKCVYSYILDDLSNQTPLKVTWDRMSIDNKRFTRGKFFVALSVHTIDSQHNLESVISFSTPSY